MKITLDESFRPITMVCGNCGGTLTVYPDSGNGKGYCPTCSPAWLKSFATFCMNQERVKHGFIPIE